MTVRLRPHHLLCLLTYRGKGYSLGFTENFDAIARRIAGGEDIVVVEGPDDICLPLLGDADPHCRRASVNERDGLAARDIGALLARPIRGGMRMTLSGDILERKRMAFADGRTRLACAGCEWRDLCTSIAADGYAATALERAGPGRGGASTPADRRGEAAPS